MDLNVVKEESDYNLDTEINIKAEPFDCSNEFPIDSYAFCETEHHQDINTENDEPIIKSGNLDVKNKVFCDPLNVSEQLNDLYQYDKKKRGPRATKKQVQMMINFVAENPILLKVKTEPHEIKIISKKWDELSTALNSSGQGPQKTVGDWKKAFQELKCNTRRKARKIIYAQKQTGGGPNICKDLSDLEKRLLDLISQDTIEGAPGVLEAGFEDQDLSMSVDNVIEDFNTNGGVLAVDDNEIVEEITMEEDFFLVIDNVPSTSTEKVIKEKSIPPPKKKDLTSEIEEPINVTDNLNKSINTLSESITLLARSIEKLALSMQNKS